MARPTSPSRFASWPASRRAVSRMGLALLLASSPFVAGCLGITVAHVPDPYLEPAIANGWREDADASESDSSWLGFSRVEVRVYEDKGERGGYPATFSVATLRSLLSPSDESLLEEIESRVETRAGDNGIRLEGEPREGKRTLSAGHETSYFAWTGVVTSTGELFQTRDAEVRILGEVWNCREAGTSVITIGMAQTTSARSLGGVPVSRQVNLANWQDIVADPSGSIEGARGERGLAWNVACE